VLSRGLAIKQPAVTIVEIDDPALAGAGVDLIDMDAVQLQSMPLRIRRVIVRAFAEGNGDPTLMAMVRATHQRDTAAVQRLGAAMACPRG
jgi:hypothetical protein